ncbi:MAG TPA: asparagine synthase (glutamine-hydrolyzing) [Ferruginibacter sp.]|nr:asparagine synthase (glutamine-hydrolyzing) [Ferruginibacter sp.]
MPTTKSPLNMCGIAGSVNFKLSYEQINRSMFHRGPDDQNGFLSENVDLYHLRLSILDISGGKQPMSLDDRYTIIFNGQIYNHNELRKKYDLAGNTYSDTETLLLLYRKKGVQFLNDLEGMFVFAIYDNQEQTLFIARDRAGKKPVYYYSDKEKFVFASELNCLKSQLPLQMNQDHFYTYLRTGSFYGSETPYRNVTELTAGSYLLIDCKNLNVKFKKWWSINPFYSLHQTDKLDDAIEKVDGYLNTSVKRRVESSDLEVGSFLSGGIDSGLVTAIASRYNNNLKTFTVSFDGEYDEAPLAKMVAEKYQTNHTEIKISFDDLKQNLVKIISNYGEPFFDSSAIPSYYVSQEAKKYVTVILNGDGADELFGGYRRYIPFSKYDFFIASPALKMMAGVAKNILPHPHSKKNIYNYIYRLFSLASKGSLEVYLSAGVDIFEDYEKNIVHTGTDYLDVMRQDFNEIAGADMSGLKKIMNMDFNSNLFSDLLVKMDIANMAHSLEGRSPFLSKELLEYAPGMNDAFKINKNTTKYLLRTLAQKYLPEPLLNQPKRGFEIPLKQWVENDLSEIIKDYVGSPTALSRQFLKKEFLEGLINNKIKMPSEKRAKMLWTLMSMEIWHKNIYLL